MSVLQTARDAGRFGELEMLEVTMDATFSDLENDCAGWPENLFGRGCTLKRIFDALPKLQSLRITGSPMIAGTVFQATFKCPQSLHTLILDSGFPVPNLDLTASNLTKLSMPNKRLVDPKTLGSLPTTLTELHTACDMAYHWSEAYVLTFRSKYDHVSISDWYDIFDSEQPPPGPNWDPEQEFADAPPASQWNHRHKGLGALRRLPMLTTLEIHTRSPIQGELIRLPKQLKSFSIHQTTLSLYPSPLLHGLYPQGLTYLNESIKCTTTLPNHTYASKLPRHLKHLRLRQLNLGVDEVFTASFFEDLPATLTSLEFGGNHVSAQLLQFLPSRLLRLDLSFGCYEPAQIRSMPRNLTYLAVKIQWKPGEEHWDEREGRSFQLAPGQVCSIWPPSLTHLKLSSPEKYPTNSDVLDHLPKTIQTLHISELIFSGDHLSRLSHIDPRHVSKISYKDLLPPTLDYYNITSHHDVDKVIFKLSGKHLPSLYPHTTMIDDSLFERLEDSSFQAFEKLESLELRGAHQYSIALLTLLPASVTHIWSEKLSTLDDRIFTILPSSVKSITIPRLRITLSTLGKFCPPSMTVLNVETLQENYRNVLALYDDQINVLDAQSFELAIEQTDPELLKFPETISTISLPCGFPSPKFWTLLPQNLTHLSLRITANTYFDQDSAKSLPKSITHLELFNENIMTLEDILALTHLKALSLPGNSRLNNEDIGLLQRNLEILNLNSNDTLNNQCVALLPRNLVELHIASAKITAQCFSDLPRTLTLLDLSGNESLSWASPEGLPTSIKILNADAKFVAKCRDYGLTELSGGSSAHFIKNGDGMAGLFDFL
jgi:hypothetical protein